MGFQLLDACSTNNSLLQKAGSLSETISTVFSPQHFVYFTLKCKGPELHNGKSKGS